jgi:hypothetical protein
MTGFQPASMAHRHGGDGRVRAAYAVAATDRQIDIPVYELYELTPEEIARDKGAP